MIVNSFKICWLVVAIHSKCSLRMIGFGLLCSKFNLLCFWAVLRKVTYYAQCYAHKYCNYATVHIQFYYFNGYISIALLQPVVFYIMLCCNTLMFDLISSILYPHEKTCASFQLYQLQVGGDYYNTDEDCYIFI